MTREVAEPTNILVAGIGGQGSRRHWRNREVGRAVGSTISVWRAGPLHGDVLQCLLELLEVADLPAPVLIVVGRVGRRADGT